MNRPLDVDVVRDVVLDEGEVAIDEVSDVRGVARQEVVDPDDLVAAIEQRLAQVRSNESRRSGDDDSLFHRRPEAGD